MVFHGFILSDKRGFREFFHLLHDFLAFVDRPLITSIDAPEIHLGAMFDPSEAESGEGLLQSPMLSCHSHKELLFVPAHIVYEIAHGVNGVDCPLFSALSFSDVICHGLFLTSQTWGDRRKAFHHNQGSKTCNPFRGLCK